MVFINSSGLRQSAAVAVRSAGEAAVAAALAAAAGAALFRGPGQARGIAIGVSVAWGASSASTAALLAAKARSPEAFWWAFGGGMAARLAALGALMAYSVASPAVSQAALLLSYVFGILGLLLLEYRHIKLK